MEAPEIIDLLEQDLTAKGAVRQWTSLAGALQEGAGIVCSIGEWPRSRSTAHQTVHASWVVSISCCTGAHKVRPSHDSSRDSAYCSAGHDSKVTSLRPLA